MIPQQIPVKNHYGNNSATYFNFDFYAENERQIIVTHTDLEGKESVLQYGIDYDVTLDKVGGKIRFPLKTSEYSILEWNEKTDEREILSIALTLPIEQPAEYEDSSNLNLANLEYSFDYLTRLLQILARTLSLTMKVSEGSGDVNLKLPQPIANNVFKWNADATALENYDLLSDFAAFKNETTEEFQQQQSEFQDTLTNPTTGIIPKFEAKVEGDISGLDARVTTAEANASTALANTTDYEGNTAINLATTAKEYSDNALTIANSAQILAANANVTSGEAKTIAENSLSEAINAEAIANAAASKIDEFGTDIEVVIEAADKVAELEGAVDEAKQAAGQATVAADNAVTAADNATQAAADAIAALGSKQDIIPDLNTIRSNATLATTALQSVPMASTSVLGGIKSGNWLKVNAETGKLECGELTKAQYDGALGYTFISKSTLENVLPDYELPSQTGNEGKVLSTNGEVAEWKDATGGIEQSVLNCEPKEEGDSGSFSYPATDISASSYYLDWRSANNTQGHDINFCYNENDDKVVTVYNAGNLFTWTSENLMNWENYKITSPSVSNTKSNTSLAYGNGIYVSRIRNYEPISSGGADNYINIIYSTNGIDWNVKKDKFTNYTYANASEIFIAYGNNVFVSMPSPSQYSTDGINWTNITGLSRAYDNLVFCNNQFVTFKRSSAASGTQSIVYVATSTNGINWVEYSLNLYQRFGTISLTLDSIQYFKGKYYIVIGGQASMHYIFTINDLADFSDFTKWTEVTKLNGFQASKDTLIVDNNQDIMLLVSKGSNIYYYTEDGINWVQGNFGIDAINNVELELVGISYLKDKFIVWLYNNSELSDKNLILYSYTGKSFSADGGFSINIPLSNDYSIYDSTIDIGGKNTNINFNTDNIDTTKTITFEQRLNIQNTPTVTYTNNIKWLNDEAPDFTEDGQYYIAFRSNDGGSTWLANSQGRWNT